MIAPRESVRAALRRALDMMPNLDAAVAAVAQAMCLPHEAVQEVADELMAVSP